MSDKIYDNENKLSHCFGMVAGGCLAIGGALLNSLFVRPLKRLFSKATGKKTNNLGGLATDIMPLNHE